MISRDGFEPSTQGLQHYFNANYSPPLYQLSYRETSFNIALKIHHNSSLDLNVIHL